MAVKREWTAYEKQSLLKYISDLKKQGCTVKEAAKNFSKLNPHITPSQARVYYYKLINETENFRKKYLQRVWTKEENDILFEHIDQYRNKKKIEIFDILSEKLNRHPKAIASHYYSLKSNLVKKKSRYYSEFWGTFKINQFKDLFSKMSKIQEIYEKAVEIESILYKDKMIIELNRELNKAKMRLAMFE